ncbi:exodeoxyribonuclease V subunit beta [Mariniluteicoccus endophyticus]
MTTPRPASTIDAFDVCGDLPRGGTWVLEASAGTGKTYTIAALAARYVAEGQPLPSLMMVTFSRAATRELRDRIRERLTSSEDALRTVLAGGDPGDDAVTRLLCTGPDDELRTRLANVSAALADFDSATIATTHEFCGRMVDGLGVLADADPMAVETGSLDDLVREFAADLWLRKYAPHDARGPVLLWESALAIAQAVGDNSLPVEPTDDPLRASFCAAVRREVAARKRALRLKTQDDLLGDLDLLLRGVRPSDRGNTNRPTADPELAEAVRRRLSERFPIVLIDEFQDTDPVQWSIVRRAFSDTSTLVLIGDPKQAIYGFRGADVHCYLDAVTTDEARQLTLPVNWRTDEPLVQALHAVWGDAELGHERIRVREVTAHHRGSRLDQPVPELAAPLRLRFVPPQGSGQQMATLRRLVADDLVADIAAVLDSGATLHLDPHGAPRPVSPRDIAVLVHRRARAQEIRDALAARGIPAVHTGANSVFAGEEARHWQALLRAFDTGRSADQRAAALTPFIGWTFPRLASATDDDLNELSTTLRVWARTLTDHGVAALMESMDSDGLAARLLSEHGGDRRYTDLRHIGQALHGARTRDRLGVAALIDWLEERRHEDASSDDDRTRRLETDEDAVRVMTVHVSKGLEFPLVYAPDFWDLYERETPDSGPIVHRRDGRRVVWVSDDHHSREEAHDASLAESRGEELRKLYVGFTRAQCQLVCWWAANSRNTPPSPLQRLLQRTGSAPRGRYAFNAPPDQVARLRADGISVTPIGHLDPGHRETSRTTDELRVREFSRDVDDDWRRTSYSGLTAAAHELPHAHEELLDDELAGPSDEPEGPAADTPPPSSAPSPGVNGLDRQSPMAGLPRGAAFGTLVHAVYETFDPAAPDLAAELAAVCAGWLDRLPSAGLDAATLGHALLPSVLTPLGAVADGLRLCDIPAGDRLPELDFEYPLAGGDRPDARLRTTLADVADLLDRHLDAADPLAAYADHLRDPVLAPQVLRGYLIGSIDAVLRIPSGAGHRYLVVDYKTNWLGPTDDETPLLLAHYTMPHMTRAMIDAHYPLQALLYCVALHRYLRWRQPGYDPATHLGGVAYLFVRGMAGPETPVVDGTPCGVFTWHPPVDLVVTLSDLISAHEEQP